MKKILKYTVIVAILFVIIWFSSAIIAGAIGSIQNRQSAVVEKSNPTITYIGDSLTNGYLSSGSLDQDNLGYRDNVDTALNATSNNFAIGGYTSYDVLDQLANDTSVNQVNQEIRKRQSDVANSYPDLKHDISISKSIENSDYVISTIGANDIINELLVFNDDGSFQVKLKGFSARLKTIQERKYDIYTQIYEINPDIEIIDIGIYFAYPHISRLFTYSLYPLLMFAEQFTVIDDQSINTHGVIIRDNMQANIKTYVDNPNDIHPNEQGYSIIANEVLKQIAKIEASK